MVSLFNCNHSKMCVVIFHCGFNVHFLMTNDVKHLVMCSFTNFMSSLVKCLFQLLDFLFNYVFFILSFVSSFWCFGCKCFQIASCSLCSSYCFNNVLGDQKLLILMNSIIY